MEQPSPWVVQALPMAQWLQSAQMLPLQERELPLGVRVLRSVELA